MRNPIENASPSSVTRNACTSTVRSSAETAARSGSGRAFWATRRKRSFSSALAFARRKSRMGSWKAAEPMQALNLMLSEDKHLVFVMGVDREKVAAGIAAKHKELLPFLTVGSSE